MAYAMNIGVLLDMDILLLILRSVIPSAESFNFFYCLFPDTAGISAAFFYLFLSITITTFPMINVLGYVASDYFLIRYSRRNFMHRNFMHPS
jgi:hypothetical protein